MAIRPIDITLRENQPAHHKSRPLRLEGDGTIEERDALGEQAALSAVVRNGATASARVFGFAKGLI